nr:L,D-transpeptidase [Halorhodospira abdelmalekii]
MVDAATQRLYLMEGAEARDCYPIGTAAAGLGERSGSGCTPRGWHTVRARIGATAPRGAVFVGRRATGEIWSRELAQQYPERDWILSRILWLSGLERGFNRLGVRDTMRRYIYIHGAPDDAPLGVACSHGCVRLGNDAIIELFPRVAVGTPVWIGNGPPLRPLPRPSHPESS